MGAIVICTQGRVLVRAVLGLVGCLAVGLAVDSASASAATKTFTAQGCGNTVPANVFTVPAGVTSVTITATASAGQTSTGAVTLFPGVGMPGLGGSGDVVSGTLSGLGSGQILDVCVDSGGGAGGSGDSGSVQNGATGGGASGVALGSNFLTPVLIAAGGGGGGTENGGGGAGLPNGGAGVGCSGSAADCSGGGAGGGGGTQSTLGAGGAVDPTCTCSATAGPGANGAASSSAGPGTGGAGGGDGTVWGGGGGGAGHFGGGGGGAANSEAGGGGGGSDFCASSLTGATLSDCTVTGTNSMFGMASVTITYTVPANALAAKLVSDSTGKGPGHALVNKATAIQVAVNARHTARACADITDYLGLVKAQTNKKLTQAQANQLTTDATNLAGALRCYETLNQREG